MEKTFLISEGPLQILCKHNEPDYGEIRRIVLGVHGLGGSSNDDMSYRFILLYCLVHFFQ